MISNTASESQEREANRAKAQAASEAAVVFASTLLPEEHSEARVELELLLGRSRLPASVPATAALAERLAVWDGELVEEVAGRWKGQRPSRRSRSHYAGMAADSAITLIADEQDLDALLALLDDPRPCRWVDFGRVRTVGDNAWRAITGIIGCDPRVFIARDPLARWTASERTATVGALRTWWVSHRHRPLHQVIEQYVPQLTPRQLLGVLEQRSVEQRDGLLDATAEVWKIRSPASLEESTLAAVLELSNGHAGIADAVAGWAVQGSLTVFLTAFHLARGDRGPLAAQLDALFAAPNDDVHQRYRLLTLLPYNPTPPDLERLVALMRRPLDAPGTVHLLWQAMNGFGFVGEAREMVWAWHLRQAGGDHHVANRQKEILPLALFAVLLADGRRASAEMVRQSVPMNVPAAEFERLLAADLRVADLAAYHARFMAHGLGQILGHNLTSRIAGLAFDLSASVPERNKLLSELRSLIGPPLNAALQEAGLPDLVTTKPETQEF